MPRGFDVSIVVPTYNERERLADLVHQALQALTEHGIKGEIVVVDDNSPDGTGDIADRLADRDDVRVVHRPGKLGLGSAVVEGFKVARAPILGVMDADLSHPPSLLPQLFATLHDLGVDIVIGSRYIPGGACTNWPWRRRVLSRAGCLLARWLTPVRDVTSGFFMVRREAIENAGVSAPGFKICLELLVRGRVASMAEVPYVFRDRTAGRSKMTFREALNYFVQLKDLYVLRWSGGRQRGRVRHVRLSEDQLRQVVGKLGT
jgi:dolichol-phosphate mannosyltransferase